MLVMIKYYISNENKQCNGLAYKTFNKLKLTKKS